MEITTDSVLELDITLHNERGEDAPNLLRLCLDAMSPSDIEKMLKESGLNTLLVQRVLDATICYECHEECTDELHNVDGEILCEDCKEEEAEYMKEMNR